MNELERLLNTTSDSNCSAMSSEIVCPSYTKKELKYSVPCNRCIFHRQLSEKHTRLKEIIPILLID